jgi:SAM-dependent methyltransferase
MEKPDDSIHSEVARYYSRKLAAHGETPQGVDWNGEAGQLQRFDQLAKVINSSADFSIGDVGCGYGALFEYLGARYGNFRYIGCDISDDMVAAARRRHGEDPRARFVSAAVPPDAVDYCVASGIFNVKLDRTDAEWARYVEETLDAIHEASSLGFAFNCLTSYSDPERMRPDLHYADPCALFDRCKRRYARNVALLHDYGLYEFSIIVRKRP